MTLLDSSLANECINCPENFPVRGRIVPEGYLLTTRYLRYAYIDDADGCSTDAHAHPEHVVFWPERACAEVEVDGVRHSLSVGQGLWVPAGTRHAVSRDPSTTLAALYLLPEAWDGRAPDVHPVSVNAALRELLSHLAETGMPRQQRLRAQRVCLELVADAAFPVIELPLPQDSRIAPICRSIMSNPADNRSIGDWAWVTSTSARTLARVFRAETGMTFSQWRTAARMSAAVRLLSGGTPVGVVARRVGYATISAFSAAFHRLMGRPPHLFLPANIDV
ncbi:hypothetical protein BSZ39_02505 [Bowdeniella nasicola]|uniref:HTH-type transcriptional regulator RipA n=1 Tax=Bowdeniella nasicola TaxID=208480 RepID=A0A1Q5Q4Q9_9ACTO|nr:hypothetical protein BSZ39_02505 [Bowdeniella nasicola]